MIINLFQKGIPDRFTYQITATKSFFELIPRKEDPEKSLAIKQERFIYSRH